MKSARITSGLQEIYLELRVHYARLHKDTGRVPSITSGLPKIALDYMDYSALQVENCRLHVNYLG